jgi:hypothetical protein
MNGGAGLSAKGIARLAGGLYLAVMPFGFFGIAYVPMKLVVPDDPAATAANVMASPLLLRSGVVSHLVAEIVFVFLVLTLFRLFAVVSRPRAWSMVALALCGVPIASLGEASGLGALDALGGGTGEAAVARMMSFFELRHQQLLIGQVFWGLWLLPLGLLVIGSRFLPRPIGVLLLLAGAGYVYDSGAQLLFPGAATVSQFTFIGEVALTAWLLVKGVDAERWRQQATKEQAGIPAG